MAFSQNGYLASKTPGDFGGLNNDPVAGTSVKLAPGVRADAAGDLLRYVFARFHLEVEPLVAGTCWGYYFRLIREGVALSNHASATAGDANAPKHPLGVRKTFTPAQRAAINRILAACTDDRGPLIRWGGYYVNRVDEMHFEVIGSLGRCAVRLAFLTQPGSVVRPPTIPDRPIPGEDDDMSAADVAAINAHTDAKFAALLEQLGNVGQTAVNSRGVIPSRVWHTPVRRPSGDVKAIQELADAKTYAMAAARDSAAALAVAKTQAVASPGGLTQAEVDRLAAAAADEIQARLEQATTRIEFPEDEES